MTLPPVAEIQQLTPADAMSAAIRHIRAGENFTALEFATPGNPALEFCDFLEFTLEEPEAVVEAVGGVIREMLVIERERMDRRAAA